MGTFDNEWYAPCNKQRLRFLDSMFTREYFSGKTVLDLGGGIGHISSVLSTWGAKCTVYEGRLEHVEAGKSIHPDVEFVHIDFQNDKLPATKFDIVLNFGVFYHLNNPEIFISGTAELAKEMMFLDGNVSISGEQQFTEHKHLFDQTLHSEVRVLTREQIKEVLADYTVTMYTEEIDRLSDSSPYSYSGNNDKIAHMNQQRIFWLVRKSENLS